MGLDPPLASASLLYSGAHGLGTSLPFSQRHSLRRPPEPLPYSSQNLLSRKLSSASLHQIELAENFFPSRYWNYRQKNRWRAISLKPLFVEYSIFFTKLIPPRPVGQCFRSVLNCLLFWDEVRPKRRHVNRPVACSCPIEYLDDRFVFFLQFSYFSGCAFPSNRLAIFVGVRRCLVKPRNRGCAPSQCLL